MQSPQTFYLGLDLGQMSDYTALTIVERIRAEPIPDELRRALGSTRPAPVAPPVYQLRHLERLPLGTPYTAVAERVKAVQQTEPLRSATTVVVVDTTGVGLPVFEMLKAAGVKGLTGISIHGGDAVTRDSTPAGRLYRVPKRDLVSTLQVLLQTTRLKFAAGLPGGDVLRHELQNFKAKINLATGHDSYEAWREGDHDDLVLSLAMACWLAETHPPPDWSWLSIPAVLGR